jgi:signal transduction histidine kinase
LRTSAYNPLVVLRVMLALAAAAVAVAAVLGVAHWFRPGAVVPTAVAVGSLAAMAVLPADLRKRLGWWLLLPGVVSLGSTAVVHLTGTGTDTPARGTILEVAALLLILIHVTRWDSGWSLRVVAATTVMAQVLWLTRYMPGGSWPGQVLACLSWGLGSAVAVAFGSYPRWALAREQQSVASARAAQQRQLERDLHDYVAHDLSGMIVQAQAARYAAADDPVVLTAALERIEGAGHRAMSSMDRALSLLRLAGDVSTDGQARVTRHPGLDELPALVARFEESGSAPTTLAVHGDPVTVPREVGEVIYRACSEALTNVLRHAGSDLASVAVTLELRHRAAVLEVLDTTGQTSPAGPVRAAGGTGLSRLRERVEALDGALQSGPTERGWRLSVRVPYAGPAA